MKLFTIFLHLLWIVFLTALTQVGGLIWIIAIILWKVKKWKKRIAFPLLYLLFNLIVIPPIAKHFGRVSLSNINENIKPRHFIYPLLFRNYVTPKLKDLLIRSSKNFANENIQITYLDANFPFYNSFPLLPHKSHNDGKKIDICFLYKTKDGQITTKKPSLSGYGIYVNENNFSAENCIEKGFWQYDFSKYLTFGKINELNFDGNSTKKIIKTFLEQPETEKIFIEPYLKQQLGLSRYNKIRFHGCKAVRHDDHIHLQIK